MCARMCVCKNESKPFCLLPLVSSVFFSTSMCFIFIFVPVSHFFIFLLFSPLPSLPPFLPPSLPLGSVSLVCETFTSNLETKIKRLYPVCVCGLACASVTSLGVCWVQMDFPQSSPIWAGRCSRQGTMPARLLKYTQAHCYFIPGHIISFTVF